MFALKKLHNFNHGKMMDMDLYEAHDYEALLNTCFEIEGLLSLMRYRQEESPAEVYDLLKVKVGRLAVELGVAGSSPDEACDDAGIAAAVAYEEAGDADMADAVPSSAPQEVGTPEGPVVVFSDEVKEMEPPAVGMPSPRIADEKRQAGAPPVEMRTSLFDELSAAPGNVERIEARVARQATGDLMGAITRNDLVRFRRELFGNSDIMFSDTIHTISAMRSYEEAEEYLYGDMGWNPEGEDVKDFMSIVRNYFGAR